MSEKSANLFIYGSLRDRRVFKSVCGLSFTLKPSKKRRRTLLAEAALLPGYRKVSPDNVYFYAIADPACRIEGYVIYDVPAAAMEDIDRYEGKRYDRETVRLNTAKGFVEAQAYLVSHESMQKHFGDRFHVNLIHELWLRKRIERFIKKHTRPGEKTEDANIERRAERELLATTERDLVITHYGSEAVSDYYLEHELDRPRPSIKHLYDDPAAVGFIKNYLGLVIKQVLLNQIDEKIQVRYRYELEHMMTSERYFKRAASVLAGLRMLNSNMRTVDLIINEGLETLSFGNHDLIDYVKYAVKAADSLFDRRVAISYLEWIRSNAQPGLMPLGTEIELSNVGFEAVQQVTGIEAKRDSIYDGFRYFNDFCLDVLCWKVGGYIDDHKGDVERRRRIGFLELAPGRLNVAGELSRPATSDPWLLNQLIHEIVKFYKIKPHSLHLSFQLRRHQIDNQKVLPLGFVKCLLVLGGGLEHKDTGSLWVSRLGHNEIKSYDYGEELTFSRTGKRSWFMSDGGIGAKAPKQATTCVQQYKFIRLEERANYEPLIMALKGLQLSCNPGDYLTIEQLRHSVRLRREYEELKAWAENPTEISHQIIGRFTKAVQDGLMNEVRDHAAHKLHYIDWVMNALNVQLRMFNKQLAKNSISKKE